MAEESKFPGEELTDSGMVDIGPDADSSSASKKGAAPSALGKFANNLPLLGIGMVVSVIGLVGVLMWQTRTTAQQSGYVEESSLLLMLSQRVAKDAREAVLGNEVAFATLQDSKNRINSILKTLVEGDDRLPASPDSVSDALQPVQDMWNSLDPDVAAILSNKSALLSIRENVASINQLSPLLLAVSDEVVEALIAEDAPQDIISRAGTQRTWSQRITKDVNVFALGGMDAAVSATQFGKDAKLYKRINRGLRRNASPEVIAKIDKSDEIFNQLNEYIQAAQQVVTEFFVSQRSAQRITENSEKFLVSIESLVDSYQDLYSDIKYINLLPFIFGGAALFFFLMFIRSLVASSRMREFESNEQNRQAQAAILKLLDEMGDLADGDLTIEAEVTDQVTGAIADSMNYAVLEMRTLVKQINTASDQVATESEGTREKTASLQAQTGQQAEEIGTATESIVHMAQSMSQLSESADGSAEVANGSVELAKQGSEAVTLTIKGMNNMRDKMQETGKRIKRLGESSQQIGEIVGLIDDIAEQTNILSLNASIQAAMAGEAGRGFAVVADEVQRLAERSAEATKQISDLVSNIQADTNEAVTSMEDATREVVENTRLADEAGRALGEIETVSEELSTLITAMANTARQQSEEATGVSGTMVHIRELTTQASATTTETAESVGRLSVLAGQLKSSVAGFRLPSED
ncbi:MAG: methyl-accepting chemotaxis protein [Arenicellales bacterium]